MNENELLEIQNELQAQQKRLNYILSSKRRIQSMIDSFEGDLAEQLLPVIHNESNDYAESQQVWHFQFVGNFQKLNSQRLFIGAVN